MKRNNCKKALAIPLALLVLLMFAGGAFAQITIGGDVYSGRNDGTGPVYAPIAPPISETAGAKVMVQDGSSFIAYGAFTSPASNHWEVTVPTPAAADSVEYVVMYSATDHDNTSREFMVYGPLHPNYSPSLFIDGYLPPLYKNPDGTPSPHELPRASLLVYVFYDVMVNGEPDDTPEDLPLNGVTIYVRDEEGNLLATGVTGSQTPPITTGDGFVKKDMSGMYYFYPDDEFGDTSLPPGEVIVTTDPDKVHLYPQHPAMPAFTASSEFYLNYTEEGGPAWDPKLYPGDPGTEAGNYLIWHSYILKLGDLGIDPANTGKVSGILTDADKANLDPDEPFPVPGEDHPGVSLNEVVPDGLVILFTDDETIGIHPIATAEADPTGYFEFNNVPAGKYKMMMFDVPLEYVWTQLQFGLAPGQHLDFPANNLLVPRFFARGQGHVYDKSTGLPLPGVTVHNRWKSGSIKKEETTDVTGWYNFDELPEIEVMGHVDAELPPGYRGAMITETFYPQGSPLVFHEDTNGNGVLDPGEDINFDGILQHYICVGDPNPYPGIYEEVACNDITFNAKNRYIVWFTANYRADLYLEPIPSGKGHIGGYVFNDHLSRGSWTGDGAYDRHEERSMHSVTVELYDATGTILLETAITGKVDESTIRTEQGLRGAYQWPPDEFGGVFVGPEIGYYEFRDVAPGTYVVKVVTPTGFTDRTGSPFGEETVVVTGIEPTVPANGDLHEVNFGINTLVPLSGEIEGGVWDDLNIDPRGGNLTADPNDKQSLLWMEKAGIPGTPVGVYDHLGYRMGMGIMGNPLCYAGAPPDPVTGLPQCPPGQNPVQKPEMEKHFAPGVHIYVGNDPTLPGYCPNYIPMALPYTFGQGKYKFEADWSLVPLAFINIDDMCDPNAPPLPAPLLPGNVPVINVLGFAAVDDSDPSTRYAAVFPSPGGQFAGVTQQLSKNANGTRAKNFFTDFVRSARGLRKQKENLLLASSSNAGFPGLSYPTTPITAMAPISADPPLSVEPGDVIRIHGHNFGDKQAYSQVILSGEKLTAKEWTDTYIDVEIDDESISGGIVVATTTGVSNALPVDIDYKSKWAKKLKKRAVYVDGSNTGPEDGSKSAPYNTITEALDNLPDTGKRKYVIVAPGTYYERIQIKESALHLIGFGPQETIISGSPDPSAPGIFNPISFQGPAGLGPVIHIGNGREGKVKKISVSGFTITGGTFVTDDAGGGIFLDYGGHDININSNIIARNGGYYGGAIWGHYSNHSLKIHSNIIAENGSYGGYGGGISINDEPDKYSEEHGEPEHIWDDLNPGPPTGTYKIYNNLFFRNFGYDYGGAICLYEIKDHLKIFGNVMMENKSDDHGGAMFFEDTGPIDIHSNVFLRNYCPDDGGAISFEDVGDTLSHVEIYNNLIAQNIADDRGENTARGGGLAFDDTFYARVYNNTIVGNIVTGHYNPAGGGIDSERNGHEYNGDDGHYIPPGFSDPQMANNIIYGNWRLNYDQPGPAAAGEETDLDYTYGVNYQWTPDEMHVDNPHLQPPWETYKNTDSFTTVHYNDIFGGYSNGSHNIDVDPNFVDPSVFNWRLQAGSPVIDQALYKFGSPKVKMKYDLEDLKRKKNHGMIDMGAFEWRPDPKTVLRIPTGIMGWIRYPTPGEPSPNDL